MPSAEVTPSPSSIRTLTICSVAIVGLLAIVPLTLGWSSGANLWILAGGLCAATLLTRAQPLEWRESFQALFLLGLTTRAVLHVLIFAWARAADGPFLSPDAVLYFRESLLLAEQQLRLPSPPYVFFGTFDCAHYYLFGAARWLLSADLFDFQALNIVVSSFVGPLTYAIARRLSVPYAWAVGLVVTFYPSLMALSVNDLMKDASVIGFFMAGTWAMVELWLDATSRTRRIVLVALAVVSLAYVRMSRFYVPAFFELAMLVALAVTLAKRLLGASPSLVSRSAVVALLVAMALIEALPMWLGWGSSPVMVWRVLNHSLETPEMRLSGIGMVDRLQAGRAIGPRHSSDLSASGNLSMRASDIVAEVKKEARNRRSSAIVVAEKVDEPAVVGPPPPDPNLRQRVTRMAANGVRKLLGPFPWVMPPSWDARTILVGDYLMFPGMIIWYLVLPVAVVSLFLVPWQALRHAQFAYPLLALTVFVGILFVQYLVLNLSYRQREFMFPFLALGSAFAISQWPTSKWAVRGYAVYVGGIVALALAHTALRAGLL